MECVHQRFSDKFGGHWIKIKFYKEKPQDDDFERLKGARFCEATKEAILYPILLDKESIICSGAQYAFGWKSYYKNELLGNCNNKRQVQKNILKSMLSQMPYFKKPFKYIGLNTKGVPDLIMSYMLPEAVMDLLKIYHDRQGRNLDVSLSAMMSICGGIAVKTYLNKTINLSFGCADSRKFADMKKEHLAIGIPKELCSLFVNQEV